MIIKSNSTFDKGSATIGDGLSIIIPIYGDQRQKALKMVVEHVRKLKYKPIEIIISEHVTTKKHYSNYNNYCCHITDGLFNKSKTVNIGVKKAKYHKCIMLDADIILPFGYLSLVNSTLDKYDGCFFLNRILHISQQKWQLQKDIPIRSIRNDNFTGGSWAINKNQYIKIGGMCEEFSGYGYEDSEFWDRFRNLCKVKIDRKFDALHLDHEHEKGYDKQWKNNQEIWNRLSSINCNVRAKQFQEQYFNI